MFVCLFIWFLLFHAIGFVHMSLGPFVVKAEKLGWIFTVSSAFVYALVGLS